MKKPITRNTSLYILWLPIRKTTMNDVLNKTPPPLQHLSELTIIVFPLPVVDQKILTH